MADHLNLCPTCKDKCDRNHHILTSDVRGSGSCPVHGRFCISNDRLRFQCNECAVISGRCQLCGEKFQKTVLVLGLE